MAEEIIKKQITKEGYDELQNELSERKTSKRSEIASRIEDAKPRATSRRTPSTMKPEPSRLRTRHVSKSSKLSSRLSKLLTIPTFQQIRFLWVQR